MMRIPLQEGEPHIYDDEPPRWNIFATFGELVPEVDDLIIYALDKSGAALLGAEYFGLGDRWDTIEYSAAARAVATYRRKHKKPHVARGQSHAPRPELPPPAPPPAPPPPRWHPVVGARARVAALSQVPVITEVRSVVMSRGGFLVKIKKCEF